MDAALKTAKWMSEKNIEIAVEPETRRLIDLPVVSAEEFADADLVVAFGGDGTLIRAAHLCSIKGTPILGVYYGRFGFVTQCAPECLFDCLEQIIAGSYEVESRMMLEASLVRAGQPIATIHALNEAVLQRSVSARMMSFRVDVDGREMTTYPADGVIVCTPTGSTAYNLSAGGPIVDPNLQALIVTAIAPHILHSRPLVLRPDSEVVINMQVEAGDSVLSADGQTRLHILDGDSVLIRRSERLTNLVVVDKQDFLIKLNRRLFSHRGLFDEI